MGIDLEPKKKATSTNSNDGMNANHLRRISQLAFEVGQLQEQLEEKDREILRLRNEVAKAFSSGMARGRDEAGSA